MLKIARGTKKEQGVSYRCRSCKRKERIPVDVVQHFDEADGGDPSVPPRFACEACGGEMWPKKKWSLIADRVRAF